MAKGRSRQKKATRRNKGEAPPYIERSPLSDAKYAEPMRDAKDFPLFPLNHNRQFEPPLELPPDMSFEAWDEQLRDAIRRQEGINWRLGRLLVYGENRYGDKYKAAVAATGLSYQTIADLKWVAGKYEPSDQSENLDWSLHRALASLPKEVRQPLMRQAEEEDWTCDQAKRHVRAIKALAKPPKKTIQFGASQIICGEALAELKKLPDKSVQTCVTSPPYFCLRDYEMDGQIGQEETPDLYISKLVEVFREVRRVLMDDGTLWLNIGDSYDNKEVIGIPWMLAFALRADGWLLRQDIIWAKPDPMPGPWKDRCVTAHEYIFLLSKSERYYFDHEAIQEPVVEGGTDERIARNGGTRTVMNYRANNEDGPVSEYIVKPVRNKRSVWTVPVQPYPDAHFATFPPKLIEPCILAGSPINGVVLDPFLGSGTTAATAKMHGRNYLGIELNPSYVQMAERRIAETISVRL